MVLFSERVSFADPGPSSDLLLSAGLGAQIDMLLSMSWRVSFSTCQNFCILQSFRGWCLSFRVTALSQHAVMKCVTNDSCLFFVLRYVAGLRLMTVDRAGSLILSTKVLLSKLTLLIAQRCHVWGRRLGCKRRACSLWTFEWSQLFRTGVGNALGSMAVYQPPMTTFYLVLLPEAGWWTDTLSLVIHRSVGMLKRTFARRWKH